MNPSGSRVWGLRPRSAASSTEIESNLLAGRSGVSLVTRFPTDDYPSRIAAQLGEIQPPAGCDPRAFSARPRLEQLAHWCAEAALRDAGLWGRHLEARVGLVLGLGAEWMLLWEDDHRRGGTRLYDPEQDRESTIERVRAGLDLTGPALALSAACASGNHASSWAGTGCGWAWSTTAWPAPATWPSRRSAWRPSATCALFAAELRSGRGVAAVRPRPRRLRSGRRRRRLRAGAIGRRHVAARRTPTPRLPAAARAATPTIT